MKLSNIMYMIADLHDVSIYADKPPFTPVPGIPGCLIEELLHIHIKRITYRGGYAEDRFIHVMENYNKLCNAAIIKAVNFLKCHKSNFYVGAPKPTFDNILPKLNTVTLKRRFVGGAYIAYTGESGVFELKDKIIAGELL